MATKTVGTPLEGKAVIQPICNSTTGLHHIMSLLCHHPESLRVTRLTGVSLKALHTGYLRKYGA